MSKVNRMFCTGTSSTNKVSVSKTLSMIDHLADRLKFKLKCRLCHCLLIVPNLYDFLSFFRPQKEKFSIMLTQFVFMVNKTYIDYFCVSSQGKKSHNSFFF